MSKYHLILYPIGRFAESITEDFMSVVSYRARDDWCGDGWWCEDKTYAKIFKSKEQALHDPAQKEETVGLLGMSIVPVDTAEAFIVAMML
jgi:hypothetical protein